MALPALQVGTSWSFDAMFPQKLVQYAWWRAGLGHGAACAAWPTRGGL